jgi:hypothetical protein
MVNAVKLTLSSTQGNPVYEYIKKEDIEAAFSDALAIALTEILAKIDVLTTLYANTAPPSLWTWDHTSRWDYDMWW